jgi:hypothetical protein
VWHCGSVSDNRRPPPPGTVPSANCSKRQDHGARHKRARQAPREDLVTPRGIIEVAIQRQNGGKIPEGQGAGTQRCQHGTQTTQPPKAIKKWHVLAPLRPNTIALRR